MHSDNKETCLFPSQSGWPSLVVQHSSSKSANDKIFVRQSLVLLVLCSDLQRKIARVQGLGYRAIRKRPLVSVKWALSPDFKIGVQVKQEFDYQ